MHFFRHQDKLAIVLQNEALLLYSMGKLYWYSNMGGKGSARVFCAHASVHSYGPAVLYTSYVNGCVELQYIKPWCDSRSYKKKRCTLQRQRSIMRFVLALTAVILQLALSTGAPSTHRRSYYAGQRPVDPEPTHQCLNFTHSFCNSAGYSTALFPNNRGQNFSEAAAEFAHFQRLLETRCSAKLGTLLCFYYFPFCDQGQWQSATTWNQPKPILPCRETCQEARDSCETLLREQGGLSWPTQFNCSKDYFLPASNMRCANGTLTVSISDPREPEPTPATPSSTAIPTSTPSTCKVGNHGYM